MPEDDRSTLELEKLRAEIRKLDSEAKVADGTRLRAWITVLSVLAGIVFTLYQVKEVAANIANKEEQLLMESRIRSHQIFLDIVPRMSGIQSTTEERDGSGALTKKRRTTFGDVTQAGAYASAVALGCQFDNLRLPAEAALTFQLTLQPLDISASTMLKRITDGCQIGSYTVITDEEREEWKQVVNSPAYKADD